MATCIPVEIPHIKASKRALVDDEDAGMVNFFKWRLLSSGRAQMYDGRKTNIMMHQLVMGRVPPGMEIDHRNGDPLDNRKSNLRFCTRQQNQLNRKFNSNNTRGFKGVSFNDGPKGSKTRPWRAYIGLNKKRIFLGSFATAKEAGEAYLDAAKKLYGEFNRESL